MTVDENVRANGVVGDFSPTLSESNLSTLARAWRAAEPNETHRREVTAALDEGTTALARLFGSRLHFGTAGVRGAMGAGPAAMNQMTVRLLAAALGELLQTWRQNQGRPESAGVVIGYDGRHWSRTLADDASRILAGMGVSASIFDRPIPTPVLAFAVPALSADAGIMITASHNPREDNGLKIYGENGALLDDAGSAELERLLMTVPVSRTSILAPPDTDQISRLGDDCIDRYLGSIGNLVRAGSARTTTVAYTALHGVGAETLERAFSHAGFPAPFMVTTQQHPDGNFPGIPFPNPEEAGVLDELYATATASNADLAMAHDPDADRLAVAVKCGPSWCLLSGDDLGCLLAEYLLSTAVDNGRPRLVANTIVSSRLLSEIAAHHGAVHIQTLTGFKWLMQARAAYSGADFVLAYEEALGYAVGTEVRDKDGIGAALVVAEMAGELAAEGRSLLDARDDLHRRHGVHVTGQRAIRFEDGGPSPGEVMAWLRSTMPTALDHNPVRAVNDLIDGDSSLPPADVLVLTLDRARLTIRPSGTEAKLKVYGECWRDAPAETSDIAMQRSEARRHLTSLIAAVSALISDPERAQQLIEVADDADVDAATEERADRLFHNEPISLTRLEALDLIIGSIDLTTLAGDDTPGRVRALCAQARRPDPSDASAGPTAAVCIYPNLVPLAVDLTRGSGVAVASVAGAFPSGLSSLDVRLTDITEAVDAGADEIDVVLNRAAFVAGRHDIVTAELAAMRTRIGERAMKVILETSELVTPGPIRAAADLAMQAGADWIKTSTGKTKTGATPAAVLAMAEAIAHHEQRTGRPVGLKISGGVRTSADALGYLAIVEETLGADWLCPSRLRFGASGLLDAVVADRANE